MFKKIKELFIKKDNNNTGNLSISKESLKEMSKNLELNSKNQKEVEKAIEQGFDAFAQEIEDAGGVIDLTERWQKKYDEIGTFYKFIRKFKHELNISDKNQYYYDSLLELSNIEINFLIDSLLTVSVEAPLRRNHDINYYYINKKFSSKIIKNKLYKKGLLIGYSENDPIEIILNMLTHAKLKEIAKENMIPTIGNKKILIQNLLDNKDVIKKTIDLNNYLLIPKNLKDLLIDIRESRQMKLSVLNAQQNKKGFESLKMGGFKYKMWLTMRDSLVCENCQIDGETISIDEIFSNGELYPSSKTCKRGCRCILLAQEKPE